MDYFDIIDKLKAHFDGDVLVNTVTQGNLFDIDLSKQTIFPLVHIIVNTASLESNDGNPTCEPFVDRFENKLAGWTMTADILIPNSMTIC